MVMTDGEIRSSFEHANQKRTQVGILTELNDCRKKDMLAYLHGLGLDEDIKQIKENNAGTGNKRSERGADNNVRTTTVEEPVTQEAQETTEDVGLITTRASILDDAKRCVVGDRDQDYGSPEASFSMIASFWGDYLGIQIDAKDVAAMMCLFKIARIRTGHNKADNWIDLAGYAACGGEIEGNSCNDLSGE